MELNPLAVMPGDPVLWRMAYCLPNFLGGLGMWLVAALAWPHRHSRGGVWFLVFALAAGLWAVCEGLSFVGLPPDIVLLAWKFQYLGNTVAPVGMVAFSLVYLGFGHWLTPRRLLLAGALPALTAVAAWTNEAHHLIWVRTWVDTSTPFPTLANQHGPLVWLYFAFANVLMCAGGLFLFYARQDLPPFQRRQVRSLALGSLVPLLASALYVARLSPWPNMDLAASVLCVSGFVFAHCFLRERLFALVPVARDEIYQSLHDPVFVVDRQGMLADCNQAGRELLGAQCLGQAWEVLVPGIALQARDHAGHPVEHPGPTPASAHRYYDIQVSILRERGGEPLGHILVWRDVSDRRRLTEALMHLASQDALTGIYNRRALTARLRLETARARRYGHGLTGLLLDIDYFKRVNDTYGHHWGDVVLKALASACQAQLRETDLFGRWGGEEFLILLPETSAEAALEVVQRLLAAVRALRFEPPGACFGVTMSLGFGAWEPTDRSADDFLNRLDQALYRAKAEGRDRGVVACPQEAKAQS